jgi:Dolichyl-phosphate-mannose-protein mannosyltransferase
VVVERDIRTLYAGAVPALPASLERAWRRLEGFAEGRWGVPSVFVAALGVYAAVSYALPLTAGRDLERYLLYYAQFLDEPVVFPYALATRTPVTPLVAGGFLEAGPVVAEVVSALLYAVSILAWFLTARRFGAAAAIVTAVALLTYPGYVLVFHELSSDAVFAGAFALFAPLAVRVVDRPTAGRAAALGAGVALLVLVRPVNQVLLLLVALPLVAATTWRARLRTSAAFVLAAVLPLLAWAGHNAVRADDFTVARGGGAAVPLFRAFVRDVIVEPENGEATRELARAVERELLPNDPYRSYEIDLDRFFSSGSARMHEDLTVLADRTWGWDDDYGHLARVGREAVLAHPGTFARGVARDFRNLLVWPLYATVPDQGEGAARRRGLAAARQLPVPSEGEPIPAARESPVISTPDGRIREVWTSPTDHAFVFSRRGDAARADELDRHVNDLLGNLPEREARAALVDRLNSLSRWYPRPVLWLVVGLVAAVVRRKRWLLGPLALAGAALVVLLATATAIYAIAQYSVPVVPAFILLAAAGVLGRPVPNVR